MMGLLEFIEAYQNGSINNNITWRGNDIPGSVRKRDFPDALKWLGFQYAREHALGIIRSYCGLESPELTKQLIEYWWCHRRASSDHCVRVKRRSAESGLQGSPLAASDDPP